MGKLIKNHYDYLALIFSVVVAAILRIVIPYSMVFQNGKVIYNAADAYYHMRYVDLIQANNQIQFADPYLMTNFGVAPFWDLLIASFNNYEVWAAYLPAILGVLVLIPVFVITKQIFKDKLITSVAVVLGAVISGLFFARTQLGAADHHALEILLLTTIMMWLVLFLTNRTTMSLRKIAYIVLMEITFLFYYLTWGIPSLIIAIIFLLTMYLVILLHSYKSHRTWFKLFLGIPVIVIIIVLLSHLGYFGYLIKYSLPLIFSSTIGEEWPLFFSYASDQNIFMDLSTTWGYFGILFFAMLVGIGMLLYRVIKYKQGHDILLLAWTVVILLLTLIMRRWAYYFAVNVVILSAFSIVVITRALIVVRNKINVKRLVFACVVGIAFIVVPFIRNDVGITRNEYNYVSKGWQEAAQFLRNQLTESQDVEYYKVNWKDGDIVTTPYVLAWWDYGYYLVREAHMPVLSHGGGFGQVEVAKLLLSEDVNIVEQLKQLNVKYIVVDSKMAVEYFYAIVRLAGQDINNYYLNETARTLKYYNTLLAKLYLLNSVEGIEMVYASGKLSLVPNETWTAEVKVFKIE